LYVCLHNFAWRVICRIECNKLLIIRKLDGCGFHVL
jgi:hypothetical protein